MSTDGRPLLRNPAIELAGHLLTATALVEKTSAALPPEHREAAEELLARIEGAVALAYRLAPLVQEGTRRTAARA
jgi:hypothetical protein